MHLSPKAVYVFRKKLPPLPGRRFSFGAKEHSLLELCESLAVIPRQIRRKTLHRLAEHHTALRVHGGNRGPWSKTKRGRSGKQRTHMAHVASWEPVWLCDERVLSSPPERCLMFQLMEAPKTNTRTIRFGPGLVLLRRMKTRGGRRPRLGSEDGTEICDGN